MNRLFTVFAMFSIILCAAGAEVYCQRPIGASKLEELEQATQLERQARDLLFKDGNYDQALLNYKLVLEIRVRLLGSNSAGVLGTLMEMALCYRARGDYTNAEETYKRVLALLEKTPSGTPAAVTETLYRYSCLMRRLGRKEEADKLQTRASATLFPGVRKAGRVTGTVVNGTRVSMPQPKYPKYVRKQKLSGSVNVSIVIDVDGTVISACAVDGPPSLAQVSEAAALRSLFTPTSLDGVAVRVSGVISYNFVW